MNGTPHAAASPREARDGARLAFIDGLRGVAVLAVLAQHIGSHYWPAFEQFSQYRFGLGAFAVTLFFLCSGFVIPASLDRHNSLVEFWIGRICRLYPLYWCSIGAALLLGALGRFPLPDSGDGLARTTAINLAMVQLFAGAPDLIGDYWTLGFELLFYLIVSLLFLARLHRQSAAIVGGLALIQLVGQVVAPRLPGFSAGPDLGGVLTTLGAMFAGSVAHRWFAGALGRRAAIALAILVPLGTVAALVPGDLARAAVAGDRGLARALSYLAAYGVLGLVLWRRQLPAFCVAAGTISYSLYLSHRLVFTALPIIGSPWASALFSLAVTLPLSLATYRAIERPGMALGRCLAAGYRARRGRLRAPGATLPTPPQGGPLALPPTAGRAVSDGQ